MVHLTRKVYLKLFMQMQTELVDVFLLKKQVFFFITPGDCLGIMVILMLGSRMEKMEFIWDALTLSSVPLRTEVPQSSFVY